MIYGILSYSWGTILASKPVRTYDKSILKDNSEGIIALIRISTDADFQEKKW